MKPLSSLLFVVALGIGVLSLGLGVVNYTQEEHFFATAEQATGTITQYAFVSRGVYCVLIEFTTQAGQFEQYVNPADCALTKKDPRRIGEHVQVYYDPANPSDTIQVRGLAGSEGSGLIVGVIVFAVLAIIGLGGLAGAFLLPRLVAGRTLGARGASSSVLRDAEQGYAAKHAAERAHPPADAAAPEGEEAKLAQLKQQADELQRKIDARRKPGQ